MLTIYGVKTCDTCRKARKALDAAGHDVTFVDLRDTPISPEALRHWMEVLGPALMNTRSTTWRGLDDAERAREPFDLMQEHPTLIKRPVIDHDGALSLGWGKPVQTAFGV